MKVTVKKKRMQEVIPIIIETEFIKLESALKFANAVESGGMAKSEIQSGNVFVNEQICTMRGKKLYPGDTISYMNYNYIVCNHEHS